MAEVTQPLNSLDASGKFGNIVFVKGGVARVYTTPTDANTPAQQAQRADFAAANEAASAVTHPDTIAAIKADAESPRYWRPHFLGAYLRTEVNIPVNLSSEYDELAEYLGIYGVTVGDVTILRAHIAWHLCVTLYRMMSHWQSLPDGSLRTWVSALAENGGPQPTSLPITENWANAFTL